LTATFAALNCCIDQTVSIANLTAPDSGSGSGAAMERKALSTPKKKSG
jgi:hypothetical protein